MKEDIDKIYAKLVSLETEVTNLRQGYMVVNLRYTAALSSLKELTNSATLAAKKACIAAEQAAIATNKCAIAAKEAASKSVIEAAEAAADALSLIHI